MFTCNRHVSVETGFSHSPIKKEKKERKTERKKHVLALKRGCVWLRRAVTPALPVYVTAAMSVALCSAEGEPH